MACFKIYDKYGFPIWKTQFIDVEIGRNYLILIWAELWISRPRPIGVVIECTIRFYMIRQLLYVK